MMYHVIYEFKRKTAITKLGVYDINRRMGLSLLSYLVTVFLPISVSILHRIVGFVFVGVFVNFLFFLLEVADR